jgi:predicted AlkP superfamily pyrophosphatase or phosphodiesterase
MVVLFLIDGLRPEAITAENMPVLYALKENKEKGGGTMVAKTVVPSSTLPCHMSLFHSVPPERHGIVTNHYTPPVRPIPGLFEVLSAARKRTAMFYNWEQLRDVARPGSLTFSAYRNMKDPGGEDEAIAYEATAELFDSGYDFAFVYFGDTDETGHSFGWLSDEYLQAAAKADTCVGMVLESLAETDIIIITADHGGHDRTHGTDSPEDTTIPFIFSGVALTHLQDDASVDVSILDIAPTVLALLEIEKPQDWQGKSLL